MTSELDGVSIQIVCPVCRAKQECQATCRRCAADLSLLVKATRSQRLAEAQVREAREFGDQAEVARLEAYLHWLRPSR